MQIDICIDIAISEKNTVKLFLGNQFSINWKKSKQSNQVTIRLDINEYLNANA